MARILNGDEDIDLNLITQKTSDIMKEMDYMDIHVDLKKGLRYGGQEIKDFSTEDEYFRTHNLVKKTKGKETDIRKDQGTTAMLDFLWKDDYDDNDVKNEVLPYRTLDIIFNKKNIFVNIQNPNPAGIEYDLYDKAKWFSVLKKRDASNDLEDEIWKQDIPAFYAFKNFLPPYTDEEIELMKKSILSSLTHTIRNVRIQKNLNSFFKSVILF
jgi:centrosomal protein CEP76